MRLARVLGLGLAFGMASVTAARAQNGQNGQAIDFRQMFFQLDANNDTIIDKDEVPEAAQGAFARLLKMGDTNHDGRLEADEMRSLGQRMRMANPMANMSPAERVKQMDKNGDGKVSAEEFPGPPPLFERIDADKDGFITKEEIAKMQAAGGPNGPAAKAKAAAARKQAGDDEKAKDKDKDKAKDEDKPADKKSGDGDSKPAVASDNAGEDGFGPRLKAMDKDGDGKITRAEFSGPEQLFDRLDLDKDGSISSDEGARLRRLAPGGGGGALGKGAGGGGRFKEMDKNGDGKLSRDEFSGPKRLFDRMDADSDGFLTPAEAARAMQGAAAKAKAKKKGS